MEVSYKIHVPRHVALDVESSNGGIRSPAPGNAQLKTSNGGLTVRRSRGT